MKVVLFCGGFGMRIRDHSGPTPKPMVEIGPRPMIWHVMRYYAHYGHKDFILCLGYGASHIKEYFLKYDECASNDFILSDGGRQVELLGADIQDWRITFVDTGLHTNIGERLKAVEPFLQGEEWFLANYTDGVTDLHLPDIVDYARHGGRAATFMSVQPNYTSHLIKTDEGGLVTSLVHVMEAGLRINGGFFVLNRRVFDHLRPGEDLVGDAFPRMVEERELLAYNHEGFWACMDTYKEKQLLEDLYLEGTAPWIVWETGAVGGDSGPAPALAPPARVDVSAPFTPAWQ
jgi:glucose-1-phosphate cytidylyltransferase